MKKPLSPGTNAPKNPQKPEFTCWTFVRDKKKIEKKWEEFFKEGEKQFNAFRPEAQIV